ncbi:MAG: hypothetical protein HUU01_03810 [Saprospiraceae bacterium]|nr:hypothetical protein [Saprospiraceae bacterium]
MSMLTVVTGIVFVLLLLSLLATTVMELLASVLSLRGKNLEEALRNMLAGTDADEKILKAFKNNSLFRQMSARYGKSRETPSYLSAESFQSILFEVLFQGGDFSKIEQKIDELPDEDLKNVLKQFLHEAEGKADVFRDKVKNWYTDVMDRASGWYKRSTQKILIGIGLAIAVIFNADTLAIYERLESNPETLKAIITMADEFVAKNDTLATRQPDPEFQETFDELKSFMNTEISNIKSPLGLGWKNIEVNSMGGYDWLTKILGWIVTAMAVSLGAPFWFDLLRKMVNLRSSGNKPAE